mmetsp:Transcript_30075/g.72641  ORF Transcript_30075/g.72641 Transcript_30075/m.72641 type:complete len:83 (+) Transcript_30075:838-1086(+)
MYMQTKPWCWPILNTKNGLSSLRNPHCLVISTTLKHFALDQGPSKGGGDYLLFEAAQMSVGRFCVHPIAPISSHCSEISSRS